MFRIMFVEYMEGITFKEVNQATWEIYCKVYLFKIKAIPKYWNVL